MPQVPLREAAREEREPAETHDAQFTLDDADLLFQESPDGFISFYELAKGTPSPSCRWRRRRLTVGGGVGCSREAGHRTHPRR